MKEKLFKNPLKGFLRQLGSLYIQRSQEEMDKIVRKEALARDLREQQLKIPIVGNPVEQAAPPQSSLESTTATSTTTSTTSTSNPTTPRYPSTMPSTPQKRNASEASLDPKSTETTPKKLLKPEAVIQSLQNLLVLNIMEALFHDNSIPLKWPRGRKMGMYYAELVSLIKSMLTTGQIPLLLLVDWLEMPRKRMTE